MSSDPVAALVAELAYVFKDVRLLHRALTHRSYVNECAEPAVADNERLEFLGDAVLDLVVSNELMQRLPQAREGELSRVRASMVSEPALAELARTLGLGPALRLGRGEELSGGRDKPSLLADGFEALVAAMYLDGGMEVATQFVLSRVKMPTPEEIRSSDSKTALQHRVQAEFKVAPRYRLARSEGPDHAKVFYVEITVSDRVMAQGAGSSKKEAEQAAAAAALLRFEDPAFVAEVTAYRAAKSAAKSDAESATKSAAPSEP